MRPLPLVPPLLLAALLVAGGVCVPSAAEALLIEVDLAAPGDGLVTRDTVAGLDWLDLPETLGLSVDDVQAGAGGYLTAGWSVATTAQVCGLFGAAGVTYPCPGSRTPSSFDFAFLSGISTLLDLLGETNPLVPDPDAGELRGLFDDGDPGGVGLAVANTLGFGHASATEDVVPSDEGDSIRGVFLVRAVPEPAAGLLLGAALLAAALRRARLRG